MDASDKARLDDRDAEFARKLALRDDLVLSEIDAALAPGLKRYLEKGCFPGVNPQEVLSDALHAVWNDFDPKEGVPLRHFYSLVAKRRMIDANRKEQSRRKKERLVEDLSHIVSPGAAEEQASDDVKFTSNDVQAAMTKLTERQRKAVKRRFGPHAENWAVQLEQETGRPAKQWRKASDEALNKLKRTLRIPVDSEGGGDEFVRSRHSA